MVLDSIPEMELKEVDNKIRAVRTAIKQAYYVDQLLMSQNIQMTATEVMQRNEEKMRLLAEFSYLTA